jgi:hypothetical protein
MSKPFRGGCVCEAVRYEVTGEPVAMVDCQCRQCQRESGTGHASHMVFAGAEVAVTGEARTFDMVGDGGTLKRKAFCPTCGSPVSMTFPEVPGIFIVRAASLDEPARYAPQFVTWTAVAQPWDCVDPTLTSFERMPPSS